MHLSEGEIRAYQDQQLDAEAYDRVKAHLGACAQCREEAAALLARAQGVDVRLSMLAPGPAQAPQPVRTARARLEARLASNKVTPSDRLQTGKEYESMWNKLFSRRARPAWVALAVIALLALSLAFPPVQAIANSFLGLFRVQQISVVQVNPTNLPDQFGSASQLESLLSKDVQIKENGKVQTVASAAEASQLAGIPVRLPSDLQGQPKLEVQPGGQVIFKANLQQIQAVLGELGRSDIQLPSTLNGATVTVNVPAGVIAQYGDCQFDLETARQQGYDPDSGELPSLPNCTGLVQMPSPTISAPPGLNLEQIGEAYLQFLGMSQQEAAHFASNVDWATTLVIPIPQNGTGYQDVQVDGVTGTLIHENLQKNDAHYLLLWVKNGIIYALSGPGDGSNAVQIVNSMK